MKLEDRTVLITGGSRGLGAAMARRFASLGAKIAIAARASHSLEEVAASIRGVGGRAQAFTYDAVDPDGGHRLAGEVAVTFGPVDLLIHNASTLGPVPLVPMLETDASDFERALRVNAIAPLRLTQAVAGSMALRGGGTIVAISSDAAHAAYPTWGAYGASKAALELCMRTLAVELEGTGVRILIVDPGEMDTQMHAEAVPDAHRGDLADPGDVAAAIARLVAAGSTPNGARVEVSGLREVA